MANTGWFEGPPIWGAPPYECNSRFHYKLVASAENPAGFSIGGTMIIVGERHGETSASMRFPSSRHSIFRSDELEHESIAHAIWPWTTCLNIRAYTWSILNHITWHYMTWNDITWHCIDITFDMTLRDILSHQITLHDMDYATDAQIADVCFLITLRAQHTIRLGSGYPGGLVSFQARITSKERSQPLLFWHLFWVFWCPHRFRTFLLK